MEKITNIAEVTELTHSYGRTIALDAVNLAIPAGRMVGIIGPDGVGKSSLLALISGVRKIQTGSIEALGGDMRYSRHRNAVCSRIAYMPQGLGRNLYLTLSVFENIDFFGRLFGQSLDERTGRIKGLLDSTGLTPFADRSAGKLSGGMKQKLGLCCALIHDPQLLILDEPTTGVDPLSRRQFWELIERIRRRRQGMSVIVATAYMDEAERFDWLVAMDAGRVLASGSPAELRDRIGAANLETAFIQLLPEHKLRGHQTLTIPPRHAKQGSPAIEANGLTRRFGDFIAVDQVSFTIDGGEIFGFLGSNGCGKTTTMKMLTGLLPSSDGEARLFGHPADARDIDLRKRVGYMSQAFSLYSELTVRQNLMLHARIFQLPKAQIAARIDEMIERFGLGEAVDELAEKLPLGVRQRLSLAVAVIHDPEVLILDEPTSGVDPVARDQFWALLIELSRHDGVTIFISTHFMNEAERCDRISLMHAGRVLAQGSPAVLIGEREAESLEIARDPIRIAFALLGHLILMIAFGYGITFDVEDISYAVLDRDQSPESRSYLENFAGSRYFEQRSPLHNYSDLDSRMRKAQLTFDIEIPPGFGKDLKRNRQPDVDIWLDGTFPFGAETAREYILGVHKYYLEQHLRSEFGNARQAAPVSIETRFRYNQDSKSVYSIVPGTIMLLLIWIPAMMTAAGVVREKEMGSITNLYATPVSGLEFLLGKQFPYVVLCENPDCGDFRHRHYHHRAGNQLFRFFRPSGLAHARRPGIRQDIPRQLFPADQFGYVHQVTGL